MVNEERLGKGLVTSLAAGIAATGLAAVVVVGAAVVSATAAAAVVVAVESLTLV